MNEGIEEVGVEGDRREGKLSIAEDEKSQLSRVS